MRGKVIIAAVGILIVIATVIAVPALSYFQHILGSFNVQPRVVASEGPIQTCDVIAGPFDIHRKYKSMEGPFVPLKITPGQAVASKKIILPEAMVNYIENSKARPSMSVPGMRLPQTASGTPQGIVEPSGPRKMYWLKGVSLEVLDEQDKPLPTAEFICHWNLECDPNFRNQAFPTGQKCINTRMIGISQGLTKHMFPQGFGIPVSSDEPLRMSFQAANRTTDKHRRLKHVARFYFIADDELVEPMTAMHWYAPFIAVVTEGNSPQVITKESESQPHCLGTSVGVDAPNSFGVSFYKDSLGRKLTGHWVVPPGTHTYQSPIGDERDRGFGAVERRLQAAWTHVHPLCTKLALVRCGGKKETVYVAHIKSKSEGGMEIQHIDWLSSKEGIVVPPGHYELQQTYENTLGVPIDSMGSMGLYFSDYTFQRPAWSLRSHSGEVASCSVQGCKTDGKPLDAATKIDFGPYAKLFNPKTDGPLLTKPKTIEVATSSGKLHFVLDPKSAPMHATQMHKLFLNHAFDGTKFYAYQPQFIFQTTLCDDKQVGSPPLSAQATAMLRRLPLEVASQGSGLNHHKYVLSMTRGAEKDSAKSSFSILLGDAPQLDREYTIFGHLISDPTTNKTLDSMARDWKDKHPWIISAKEI